MLRRAFGGELGKGRMGSADREGDRLDADPKRDAWPAMAAAPEEGDDMADRERESTRTAGSVPGELNALLGKGSEFDGKLAFEGTVRIDGTFSGEITTSDTLIVGEGAKVQAEISCGTIVVHGQVGGNIHATHAVELHAPARVKGDVTTPSLMVEKGVVFEGHSKMEDLDSHKIVPMVAAEAD